jgi:hypothetical protein
MKCKGFVIMKCLLTLNHPGHMLNAMSRPKTKQDDLIKRTTLQMPIDLAEKVSDWRHEARLAHWNDAVVELVRIGLEAKRTQAAG